MLLVPYGLEEHLNEHGQPECPNCRYVLNVERVIDGADADGHRGQWVDFIECPHCDWTPGDDIDEEDDIDD